MKKLLVGLSLVGALCTQAAMVTVTPGTLQGGNSGGQFTATTDFAGTFQTFCLEIGEYLSFGAPYNVTLNSAAVAGGGGPNPDPISLGTAWLFSRFAAGTLVDSSSAAYGTGGAADATDLQLAIWMLEGEWDASTLAANRYYAAIPLAYRSTADTSAGLFGVQVMNLYEANGARAQDLLVVVPEPTTIVAGALLLLPFGISTIRRFRKA